MNISRHAETRLQQRGVHESDLALFLEYGIEFDDGLLMTNATVAEAIAKHQTAIWRLEKLRGKALITMGDVVVTTYNPSKRRIKHFLRRGF
jgi:hypothetical protein